MKNKTAWPIRTTEHEPVCRPLVFNPYGFLVTIFDSAGRADLARSALAKAGFADDDLRIYTGAQILAGHERFLAQHGRLARFVAALTDDPETIKSYLGYARAGGAALWIRVPDDAAANRAVRALADHPVLHLRHYGRRSQVDIHAGEAGLR